MKKFALAAVAVVLAAAGALYLFIANFSKPQPDGMFSATYVPSGWTTQGDSATSAIVTAFISPDYLLENPAVVEDCSGTASDGGSSEGCVMNANEQVLGRGAYLALAYDPCIAGDVTEAAFRQRELENGKDLQGLVDQKPIVIAGHTAVLFHTRNLTNTTHPAMEDNYHFTVVSSVKKSFCQDVNFGFVESTTTDYGAEYRKFIDGLRFTPDKSAEQ